MAVFFFFLHLVQVYADRWASAAFFRVSPSLRSRSRRGTVLRFSRKRAFRGPISTQFRIRAVRYGSPGWYARLGSTHAPTVTRDEVEQRFFGQINVSAVAPSPADASVRGLSVGVIDLKFVSTYQINFFVFRALGSIVSEIREIEVSYTGFDIQTITIAVSGARRGCRRFSTVFLVDIRRSGTEHSFDDIRGRPV